MGGKIDMGTRFSLVPLEVATVRTKHRNNKLRAYLNGTNEERRNETIRNAKALFPVRPNMRTATSDISRFRASYFIALSWLSCCFEGGF